MENTKVDLVEVLEQLVDKHGLLHITVTLELMCAEKADHIRMNWQDTKLAREWDRAANGYTTLAQKIQGLNI